MQQVSMIRQLTNDEFALMHVSKPKESILKKKVKPGYVI